MKTRHFLATSAFGLVAAATPLLAHHSVQAEYDTSRTITIQGTVNKIEWLNPHARFWVDAQGDDGSTSIWELELPPPNALGRENIGKDFLKQGDRVVLEVWRAKDGSSLAHVLTLTRPDGRVVNFPHQWPDWKSGLSAAR